MKPGILRQFKPFLIILGWAASTAALTLFMIFNGQLLPRGLGGLESAALNPNPLWLWTYYLGTFAIAIFASMVISDIAKALISFFASYVGAALITLLVIALPDFLGIYPIPGSLENESVLFAFDAFFPIPFLIGFGGMIIGAYLAERLL